MNQTGLKPAADLFRTLQTKCAEAVVAAMREEDFHGLGRYSNLVKKCSEARKDLERLRQVAESIEMELAEPVPESRERSISSDSHELPQTPRLKNPGSHRMRGKSAREVFAERVRAGGKEIRLRRGRIYETPTKRTLGLSYASERSYAPDKWWMGLPDQPYEIVAFLCEAGDGTILDFVVPFNRLAQYWKRFSRHANQIEFHITKSGQTYYLQIPGGDSFSLNSYRSEYSQLS